MRYFRTLCNTVMFASLLLPLSINTANATQTSNIANNEFNQAAKQQLSLAQVEQDVALLKEAYSRLHPAYSRYTTELEMDAAWQAISEEAAAKNGLNLGEFYLAIQKALTHIKCDHTKANLPKSVKKDRNEQPLYLPFTWEWIDNTAIVTSATEASGLQRYDEIISIDSEPISQLVAKVIDYVPNDGYTNWSRYSGVASSKEFMGGALDHFGSLLWNVQPRVDVVIRRSSFAADKSASPSLIELNASRINHKQWSGLPANNEVASDFKDAVDFKIIDANTAYLGISTFVNYRNPVDPQDIYEPIFKQIQNERISTLILDLRENGGGSTDASQGLLANLITSKMQFKTDMRVNTLSFEDLRPYLWTWDKRALDPWRIGFSKNEDGTFSLRSWVTDDLDKVKPAKYSFNGKVIALTSRNNSSASTNLLSVINGLGRTTLVGEKTGGSAEGPSAGLIFTLNLPASKITTRIPFFLQKNNVTTFDKGMGLTPDVKVNPSAQDFSEQTDIILEKALLLATNPD